MKKQLFAIAAGALLSAVPTAASAAAFFTLDIFAPPSNNTSLDNPRFLLTNTSTANEQITQFKLSYAGKTTIIDTVNGCGTIAAPPSVDCGNLSPTTSDGLGSNIGIVNFDSFPATGQAAFRFEFDEPGVNGSNSDFRNVIFSNNATVDVTFTGGVVRSIQLGAPAAAAVYSYNSAVAAVPEPATWAMMMLGFGAVAFAVRRRRATVAFA